MHIYRASAHVCRIDCIIRFTTIQHKLLFHCIQKMYQQKSIAAICPIFPLTWPDLDFQVVWLSRLSTNVYILALFSCWCALNSPHTSYLRIFALLWQFSVDSTFSFAMIGQLFTTRIPETFFNFNWIRGKLKDFQITWANILFTIEHR